MRELCIDEIENVSGGIDIDWNAVRDAAIREAFKDAAGGFVVGAVGGGFAGWFLPVGPVGGAAAGAVGGATFGFLEGAVSGAFGEFMDQQNEQHDGAYNQVSTWDGGGQSGGGYFMGGGFFGGDSFGGDFWMGLRQLLEGGLDAEMV